MKCPICAEETAGQETQQWGPEWAHKRCVKAYNIGKEDARAAVQANVPDGWRPIETAPENMADPVVVFWIDREGEKHHDFDYTEDGCWMQWHNHAEHVVMIGGYGVSYTAPYTHWMPLPAAPGAAAPPVAQPIDPLTCDIRQVRYMDIYSRPGTRVVFHGRGGYDSEQEHAKKTLTLGDVYEVERTEVGRSSSTVRLRGFSGMFNTVMFGPAPTE